MSIEKEQKIKTRTKQKQKSCNIKGNNTKTTKFSKREMRNIKGTEKNVLIDYVKDWDGAKAKVDDDIQELDMMGKIDYLIVNHMEPDHTGALKEIVEKNPNVEILCSKKAIALIEAFYGITENVRAVSDGETLDIGGKTLQFFMTPNVHWPETMMTYLMEDGILFSCDAFGAYGVYGSSFDDEVLENEWPLLLSETERYYANIISSFASFTLRAIKKLEALDIKVVCPSHGIIWRQDPLKVVKIYERLANYGKGILRP